MSVLITEDLFNIIHDVMICLGLLGVHLPW